jgi:hypothetical protein
MRNYVDRHFLRVTDEQASLARNHLATFELSFGPYLDRGVLEVSLERVRNAAHNLSISIKGMLDVDFFDSVGTHLETVLRDTPSSVTLKIEEIHGQAPAPPQALRPALRYGTGYIAVNEKLRQGAHRFLRL